MFLLGKKPTLLPERECSVGRDPHHQSNESTFFPTILGLVLQRTYQKQFHCFQEQQRVFHLGIHSLMKEREKSERRGERNDSIKDIYFLIYFQKYAIARCGTYINSALENI